MTTRQAAAIGAVVFLSLHLPYQAASLEDLDSINFALGLRDFDVAAHQPHPPGYPLFIAVARGALAVTGSETAALSLTSVFAGAVAVVALLALFAALFPRRRGAVAAAAALAATAPLFWLTASRPLSDTAGLAALLAVQALTLRARTVSRLAIAAAAAGFAVGIRSQVAWLTVPLLALVVVRWTPRLSMAALGRVSAAYVAGALAWAVPLVVATGGPASYWQALSSQGAEDFSGVAMLWTSASPRLLVNAVLDTFVAPWGSLPMAVTILALAALGAAHLLMRDRVTVAILAAGFVPYLVFHLLFQETFTTRYALPLVVPVACLAMRGFDLAGRPGLVVAGALAVVNLVSAQSTLAAYAGAEAPAFRLLADMGEAGAGPERPILAMHRRAEFDFRRPIRWVGDAMPPLAGRLPASPKHEWLEVVKYWNDGGRQPVWFIADPLRSDLALVADAEPRARYRWPFPMTDLVGGARPNTMDWHVFDRPAWYLGEGWALTPETAGVAGETGRGPGVSPIEGWIRRTPGRVTMMIGGRNLDEGGPPIRVTAMLDGAPLDEWIAQPGFFLRWVETEPGRLAGPGDYARLTIASELPRLAIEQFDARSAGQPVYGFADGWHELEYNPRLGRLWRWTSDRARLDVRPEGRDLRLSLAGETDPTADRPSLVVRAGGRVLLETHVDGAFAFEIAIPSDALGAEGTVTIETDKIHVPAERSRRSMDRRRLGLRVYEAVLSPAS